jgi:hypothetical protein
MGQGKIIRDTAEAVEGLVKAVPVYQDLAQPAVKEVGIVVARVVHTALAPLRLLCWGWEQIEQNVFPLLVEKLKGVPDDRIVTPPLNVAGPALESLRFTGRTPELRELFTNLLATAMDRATAQDAHPSFVEIIKQLTPDEAKIIALLPARKVRPVISVYAENQPPAEGRREVRRHLSMIGIEAGCEHAALTPNYLGNLCRLGLTEIPVATKYTDPRVYEPIENHPDVSELMRSIEDDGRIPLIVREALFITDFGAQFLRACVLEPNTLAKG